MSLYLKVKRRLNGFSIDAELRAESELMVLFGPSGAGKSLLLKMISGIERPDEGMVEINNEFVFDSSRGVNAPMRERGIGYVFQEHSLFPHMTVYENISYGLGGLSPSDRDYAVRELIGLMRLNGLEGRFPHELSGGQKQRVSLARTLAPGPRLLLLDEPFSALDHMVREKLRGDLMNIHERFPITTLLVTHDLEEAFMMGTKIAVVNNGSIEQVGSREDVFYRPKTRNVARFVGARNIYSGRVMAIEDGGVVIQGPGFRSIVAQAPEGMGLRPGQGISFCIRPEEIHVVRPDKPLGPEKAEANIIDGVVSSIAGMGSTHVVYVQVAMGGWAKKDLKGVPEIKVEVPNSVVRKLGLAHQSPIRVLLKKEGIWIIPEAKGGA